MPDADDIEYYVRDHEIAAPIRAIWTPQNHMDNHVLDIETELTRLMSEEISRGVDEDIINRLTRRINGGHNDNDANYFNYWLRIGDNRA
jgi:hypothetical protein